MSLPPPPDAVERARALDPARSFIVQAPAGSGKTELLIRRYLALLKTVGAPEEIVAITFTRKAAAEMRARVLKALEAHGDALVENPARLRIQTIDSFCASLTRQMPMLSKFGAQPESIEDARELYAEAARDTVALVEAVAEHSGRSESAESVANHVERLLEHLDNDRGRVEALLAGMLARRDHWIRHLARMDRAELEAGLAAERARIAARAAALYPGTAQDSVENWQALAESLLTRDGGWRKRSPEAKGYFGEGGTREPLRAALLDLRALPPACYSDAQWQTLEAIAGLLPQAIARLTLVFQSRGQVDFTEVAQGALRALGEEGAPTDLALALDYRIRHLLIDEFQDTSISQSQLVARLTEGWEPGDGRTLFAVGDPMQSIYRFREAEVGLFLRARAEGLGTVALETVELSANFRSQSGIVDWVNQAFARVMPAADAIASGAVRYAASKAVHAALPGPAVSVHPFFDKDRQAEATRVAQIVAEAQAADGAASLAILVRTRSHLAEIVPQLKCAGLRFRAIEIEALAHRPVVQDLLAMTRALAHPADRLAWLAVLRAPWCGLRLDDLSRLAEGGEVCIFDSLHDTDRVARLSDEGRARVERLRGVLDACFANRQRGTLRDAVEGAWLALGGPACVEDPTDLEDAGIYLDHLEAHEEAGQIDDAAAFEDSLQALYALPDVLADERLQVMTIHKAKGLEFDHVIVPGLGRAPRNDDRRLFLWTETAAPGGSQLLIAPIQQTGVDGDPIYAWLQSLEAIRAGFESTRLLYVAATRAKQRLHLLGETAIRDGRVRPPAARSLLARLWPVVAAEFEAAASLRPAIPAAPPPGEDADAIPDQSLVRLAAGWQCPDPPPGALWQAPVEEARAREDIEFSWAGETARHVGSVVHRWLQRIGGDELRGWDGARIASLRAHFARELAASGVVAAEIASAVERIAAALVNCIEDGRGRWLLGVREAAASELRLRVLQDGRLRTLIIDRSFVADGQRWVVDYKTSRHEGAGVEAFLERERVRYAPQLARYAAALGAARQGLYFPMLHGWREWDSNDEPTGN